MTTWFTADQHLCHSNIIRHCDRPYASVADMNEAIVANHNAVVRAEDDVFHLGDFLWGNAQKLAWWLSRFNGKHHLVPGNHDGLHSHKSKWTREVERYKSAGFDVLLEQVALNLPDIGPAMLCHFPLRECAGDDVRYPEYRPQALLPGYRVLLCGHVHEKWLTRGRCLNVGVDQFDFAPVSTATLANVIAGWS